MPTPTPTDEQIETVREMAFLYSAEQTAAKVNYLSDAGWAATLTDITAWGLVKNKHTRIKGDGLEINKEDNRRDITIRVRRRLGIFPAVPTEYESSNSGGGSYCSYNPGINEREC